MALKRVVVTGLGALTPIGNNLDDFWTGLIEGKSGAAPITYFDTEKFKTKFACELKNFDVSLHLDRKQQRKMDRFTQYGMVSTAEAIEDSGLDLESVDKLRVGVIWGSGIGGIETFQNQMLDHASGDGTPRFNPFFIPKMIADIIPGFLGGGLSSDAHHITAPHPEGNGVKAVIKNCLNDSKVNIQDVDLINTHGTSTPLGDVAELKAIDHIFGNHAANININSTKSMTGHLLGAAGAVEAISVILSLKNGIVPPTINHQNVDENINPKLNLTLNKAQKREAKIGMSNTFGFGGHNACVLFKKWD